MCRQQLKRQLPPPGDYSQEAAASTRTAIHVCFTLLILSCCYHMTLIDFWYKEFTSRVTVAPTQRGRSIVIGTKILAVYAWTQLPLADVSFSAHRRCVLAMCLFQSYYYSLSLYSCRILHFHAVLCWILLFFTELHINVEGQVFFSLHIQLLILQSCPWGKRLWSQAKEIVMNVYRYFERMDEKSRRPSLSTLKCTSEATG